MIVDDTSLFDNIANNILRQHCNNIENIIVIFNIVTMAKAFFYCLQLYIVNNIVNNMLLTGATILFTILFEHIFIMLKLFLSLEQCFNLFWALLFLLFEDIVHVHYCCKVDVNIQCLQQ